MEKIYGAENRCDGIKQIGRRRWKVFFGFGEDDMGTYVHCHVFDYRPSLEEVKEMLSKVHPVTDLQPLVKTHAVKQLTPSKEVIVAHYDARQFNYVQYSDRGETLDLAEDPAIELFNEYYGGGMNAIVFQEMRESRALA